MTRTRQRLEMEWTGTVALDLEASTARATIAMVVADGPRADKDRAAAMSLDAEAAKSLRSMLDMYLEMAESLNGGPPRPEPRSQTLD